jgi:hypothetical protein
MVHGALSVRSPSNKYHGLCSSGIKAYCVSFVFSLCSLQACDDDCVGPLLNDLDSVGDAVLSLNLTGVSPAPYGILENLENTTKYFQVGARDIEMVARNSCH